MPRWDRGSTHFTATLALTFVKQKMSDEHRYIRKFGFLMGIKYPKVHKLSTATRTSLGMDIVCFCRWQKFGSLTVMSDLASLSSFAFIRALFFSPIFTSGIWRICRRRSAGIGRIFTKPGLELLDPFEQSDYHRDKHHHERRILPGFLSQEVSS